MTVYVDDTEAVQSFVRSISTSRGSAATTSNEDVDMPAAICSDTPTPASTEHHPLNSPHIAGLLVPQNTPVNRPRGSSDVELLDTGAAVNEAFYDIFSQKVKGVPLSESIWAPKNFSRHHSKLNENRRATDYLTHVKAVSPNPSINDTFKRMSFQAADTVDKPLPSSGHSTTSSIPSLIKLPPKNQFEPSILVDAIMADTSKTSSGKAPHELLDKQVPSQKEVKVLLGKDPIAHIPPHLRVKASASTTQAASNISSAMAAETEVSTPKSTVNEYTVPPFLDQRKQQFFSSKIHKEPALPSAFMNKWGHPKNTPKESFSTSYTKDEHDVRSSSSAIKNSDSKDSTAAVTAEPLTSPTQAVLSVRPTNARIASATAFAPCSSGATISSTKGPENLERESFFQSWPVSEKRDKQAAQIRKVILKNLPPNSNPAFVASLIYCGPLEQIHIRNDDNASVRFLKAKDCNAFYEDTSNGLVYGKDLQGKEKVIWVSLAKDVDVIGGLLGEWIEAKMTRCVRVVPIEDDMGKEYLLKIASCKGRNVEGIDIGQSPGGSRFGIFRFTDISHAVTFKAALARDEDWEHCQINFAIDPCAEATGPRVQKEDTT